jgi:soluble lytic murein transglycosylase
MAQESTFTAEIKSSANAVGLMQLIPSTGRRYAKKLGIRNFSTSSLTKPEVNVRLGTEYLEELIERFGGAHYALASYNAGENRVEEWIAERPGLPADEFIDDIPFPETQNYVKRILGTAEDYRRLYGGGLLDPHNSLSAAAAAGATATRPASARPVPSTPAARPKTPPPARRAPSRRTSRG